MDFIIPGNPSIRQKEFLTAEGRYIAYGGARGGGKSWAVRVKAALLALRYAGIKILIVRRTYPELRENHILPLMSLLKGISTYRDIDKSMTFPTGSRIKFGYCDSDRDLLQYQGQEYDVVFIDEATQFQENFFDTIKACVRGANDFPKRIYLTCNPGGVGHAWVKRLFIDREYKDAESPADYTFIKATVYDNPALLDNDPDYIRVLETLPDEVREAWLNGNWDVYAGQYFTEFKREVHVIEPFVIPDWWQRYFVMDYGLDMFAGYWVAVDAEGMEYIYREVYKPNLIISDMIAEIKAYDDKITSYYAPPDMWNRRQDTGESVAERALKSGIYFNKVSNDRVMGFMTVKEHLKVYDDKFGEPCSRLRIFENCLNLIRCIPLVQYSDKNPNDVSTEPHNLTHSIDALRYFCSARTQAAEKPKPEPKHNFEFEKPKPNPLGAGQRIRVI